MGNSNGLITIPVSISDIAGCIGSGSRDLGTLCTSPSINKWSMYKPVKYAKRFGMTRNVYVGGKPADDYYKANYGLVLPDPVTLAEPITIAKLSSVINNDWGYERPTGGSNSPYRMEDFIGYDHNAASYLTVVNATVYLADLSVGQEFVIQCIENTDSGAIPFDRLNLEKLGNNVSLWMYAFKPSSGSQTAEFTKKADGNIVSGESALTFTFLNASNYFDIGSYELYYVLRGEDGLFYPIPNSMIQNPKHLYVRADSPESSYLQIQFYIGYNTSNMKTIQTAESYTLKSSLNPLYVKVTIRNTDTISHGFSVSEVRFKNMDSGTGTWIAPKSSDLSIPANGYLEKIYELEQSYITPVVFGGNTNLTTTVDMAFVRNNIVIKDVSGGAEGVLKFDRSGGEAWI